VNGSQHGCALATKRLQDGAGFPSGVIKHGKLGHPVGMKLLRGNSTKNGRCFIATFEVWEVRATLHMGDLCCVMAWAWVDKHV